MISQKDMTPAKMHAFIMESAQIIANEFYDGHFSIMKFTTGWRFSFSTPSSKEDVSNMSKGETLHEAFFNEIYKAFKERNGD